MATSRTIYKYHIVHDRRSITPALSIRFGAFFGQSDEFWHGLQVECGFANWPEKRRGLPTAAVQLRRQAGSKICRN